MAGAHNGDDNIMGHYRSNGCKVPFFVTRWSRWPMVIKVVRVDLVGNYGHAFGHFVQNFSGWSVYADDYNVKKFYPGYKNSKREFMIKCAGCYMWDKLDITPEVEKNFSLQS